MALSSILCGADNWVDVAELAADRLPNYRESLLDLQSPGGKCNCPDVLGTWLLSILDGQRRCAHINGLRGDAVAPQILGMSRIISD